MKRIKIGDLFEIETKNGVGYFQCIKLGSASECEVIRVLHKANKDFRQLVLERELYFVLFPLKYALKQKKVKLIGNYDIPKSVVLPKYYRDKHIVRGEFISWHIIDSETLKIRSVKELSEDERSLSPAGIWNDTLLSERIAEEWKPEIWV